MSEIKKIEQFLKNKDGSISDRWFLAKLETGGKNDENTLFKIKTENPDMWMLSNIIVACYNAMAKSEIGGPIAAEIPDLKSKKDAAVMLAGFVTAVDMMYDKNEFVPEIKEMLKMREKRDGGKK